MLWHFLAPVHRAHVQKLVYRRKSIFFSCFILLGYICGICGKIVAHNYNLAFIFYIINTVMVTVDILLWIRNYRYEKTGKKTFFI